MHEPRVVDVTDRELLSKVVGLADRARKTLGFLPPAVFQDSAKRGTLVAVVDRNRVAAYVLYSLPRDVVRLTHLCVDPDFRGRGLARVLVDWVSARHRDRTGIVLRCRTDYKENRIWPRLGFVSNGQIRGRGRHGAMLEVWWRDHDHPKLFAATDVSARLRVAIDTNVFLDLESTFERSGAEESKCLTADWIQGQIELVGSDQLRIEVEQTACGPGPGYLVRALNRYRFIGLDEGEVERHADRIEAEAEKNSGLDLGPADRADLRHVACADLGGADILATRDDRLLRWATALRDVCGAQVLHPSDVVTHLDELARARAYRPVDLQNTAYRLVPVRAGMEQQLKEFLNREQGEESALFIRRMRDFAAHPHTFERFLVTDPNETPVAVCVTRTGGPVFRIEVLRVRSRRLDNTIVRHLLFHLRQRARQQNLAVLQITDPYLDESAVLALREEGYFQHHGWTALAVDACGTASEVDTQITDVSATVGLRTTALRPGLSAVVAAAVERSMWPAKITDSELPTYLVPIRPPWSSDLFNIPAALPTRPDRLGLSREHVYYRSPQPRVEQAPARLLWYVSGKRKERVGAIIGCSRLEEVVADKPQRLHARFRHLGVWHLQQIQDAARQGKALALRFADTEIFPWSVHLSRLNALASTHGRSLSLRSPQRISSELFAAIYREGQAGR